MTLTELKGLGRRLTGFLAEFRQCFASVAGRRLLRVYVQGQLSDVPRKNCEAIALRMNEAPRTLQRFLESIKWDESQLRDRCQEIIARDHAHAEATGLIDESGTVKSGDCTAGAARQYNGNRGKIENCIMGVHLGYSTPGLQTLLDRRLYLPRDWAEDAERRKENGIPDDVTFQTKPQIAIDMVDRALSNGVRVAYWTCDELYGRDGAFLDALEARNQAFVAEIPIDMRVWTKQPQVVYHATHRGPGRPKQTPYVAAQNARCEVRSLLQHSSKFHRQTWQRDLIKDTKKGPEVWEIKHLTVWRNTSEQLPQPAPHSDYCPQCPHRRD